MTHKSPEQRIAVFAGSFNPFTVGHADIVQRALPLFDHIYVCVGINASKPDSQHDALSRVESISKIYADNPKISVEAWSGLTADFARKKGANFLLRGVRTVKDFEYERDMADANRALFGLESVVLFADPSLSYISSSLVRDLASHGYDTHNLTNCKYED